MKKREFISENDGVVGIVVTVLLIGLILTVTVMINTVYVPQWIEEKEANHMEEVSNQFTRLKYALDIQSIVNDSTAVSTFVTLGSKEIPIFGAGRSFGILEIIDNSFTMSVETNGTSDPVYYSTESIVFSSQNSYFVDQSYACEAGALILDQEPSNVLYGKPSLIVREYNTNLSFVFVNVSGLAGKKSVSGYGTFPIYTEVTEYNSDYKRIHNVTDITVNTDYPHAWYIAFNSTLHNHWIDYEITEESDRIVIRLIDADGRYIENNFFIREVKVSAQIAFGLSE